MVNQFWELLGSRLYKQVKTIMFISLLCWLVESIFKASVHINLVLTKRENRLGKVTKWTYSGSLTQYLPLLVAEEEIKSLKN